MNKKRKFIIAAISAMITFGTLMATKGPRHYKHWKQHCGHFYEEKKDAVDLR
ncbi:MAG: hypothetical protein IT257_07115 [Chitinophagaceae bacterium]|nr:hypothetical protein [Chitinophagaceae bacterium]